MATSKRQSSQVERRLAEATSALSQLGFNDRQSNRTAAFTLLALLNLRPETSWSAATAPLRGITPIIEFIADAYGKKYKPNSRETIRDEAVKHFVEAGIVVRNPDDLARPTNSGKTVYQVESAALELLRSFGSLGWQSQLAAYREALTPILTELQRRRRSVLIPVQLPDGQSITISPGGQNPLIKKVVEEFCRRFTRAGNVLYVGDAEDKFRHLNRDQLSRLGITVESADKMPDVVIYHAEKNWLVLIEAVTSAGSIDGKRRAELKRLFRGSNAGLVFVSAFETMSDFLRFATQISWETEVWIADAPEHLIHFDGDRFLGPYPDALPHVNARP